MSEKEETDTLKKRASRAEIVGPSNWKATLKTIGITVLSLAGTAFVTGVCTAAGSAAYHSMTRRKQGGDLIPLRKQA